MSKFTSDCPACGAPEWAQESKNITHEKRLHAAAPEMYKALKWAISVLDAQNPYAQNPCDAACTDACSNYRARALLARIDGDERDPRDCCDHAGTAHCCQHRNP